MSAWFSIPSCRPAAEAEPLLAKWRERGYRIALLRQGDTVEADLLIPTDHYLGWCTSINILVRRVLEYDPEADWLIGGGDDTEPDPQHTAEEIAQQCREHFRGTFGVMQPTGDKALWPGSNIEGFAGSPWMGREFCQRINGGHGPMREEFTHMFGDEAAQCIAIKYGAFWQRPDLIHKHMHWGRKPGATRADIPDFMQEQNSREHWEYYGQVFRNLQAAGWPGSEPLEPHV